jgi:hypothetical protein
MSTFEKIFALILGSAEQVVPIFIHNPKSQQIEGVIVSTLNGVLSGLAAPTTPATPPTA